MTVSDFSERELVERIHRRLSPPPSWLLVGIGDDAAVVEPERNRVEVLSVDCLVEGVHFDRAFVPSVAIGHRAMAANLSDLAAMAAAPRLALISLALPPALPIDEFDGLADGFCSLAVRHSMHVVGGNLTRTPGPLTIDVTVVGTAKRRQTLVRSGARAGDELWVTGTVGAAAAGLQLLRSGAAASAAPGRDEMAACVERYLRPEPRVRIGTLLGRNHAASACMDLSDGLADAVRQVAESSGVGAAVDADAVPVDSAARSWFAGRGLDAIEQAIVGGDDYELLFTVRPRQRRRAEAVLRRAGASATRIGVCTAARDLVLTRARDGVVETAPLPAGYTHFR